jgi:hypothetical protein
MSRARVAGRLAQAMLAGVVVLALGPAASAGIFGGCCQKCPPPYIHCQEGCPRIRFKCACPRPICGPCELEHNGYYPTCWQPWPYPPDYSHCPTPPPGFMVPEGPLVTTPGPQVPQVPPEKGPALPVPKRMNGASPPG